MIGRNQPGGGWGEAHLLKCQHGGGCEARNLWPGTRKKVPAAGEVSQAEGRLNLDGRVGESQM